MRKFLLALCFSLGFVVQATAQTCPYTSGYAVTLNPWYWSVQDTSPGTDVWDGKQGGYVVLANATYVAWLALGCAPTIIDTQANLLVLIDSYNRSSTPNWSYQNLNLGVVTSLSLNNPLPTRLDVSASGASAALQLPEMNLFGSLTIGKPIRIYNYGAVSVQIQDRSGTQIVLPTPTGEIPGGATVDIDLTSNTTINGTFAATAYLGFPIPTGTPMAGSLLATAITAPGTPASGKASIFVDSTTKTLKAINDAGTLSTTVIADTGAANNFLTAISLGGVISKAQPAFSNLSGNWTLAQGPTIGANTVLGSIAGGVPAALTQTQLTSLVNVATASLSGALPAWPNNTTTFLRGDGTYATNSCAALTDESAFCAGTDAANLTGTLAIARIANGSLTYAKIQDVSATSRILGRITAGAGVTEELTAANVKTILALQCSDLSNGATGCSTTVGTMATQAASAVAITGGTIAGLTGFAIRDTTAAFDVTMAATSTSATISAGRTITWDVGNVAHTIKLGTTANTITFPNLASYTVITNGDTGSVTNAMLAGSIAYSKLSLTGAILNADLAGSIAASKLVGTDIVTVGTLTAGATGAGFTVALTTSTITGTLPAARLPSFGSGDVSFASGGGAGTLANIPTGVTMAGSLLATAITAPGTPASGKASIFVDSTTKTLKAINDAGTLSTTVIADTGASNNFLTAISAAGVISKAQPAFSNLSGAWAAAQVLTGGTNLQYLQTNGSGTGAWASLRQMVSGSNVGPGNASALAGGQTAYFTHANSNTTAEYYSAELVPYAGTFKNFYAFSVAPPGAAQTYTFTVYVNGSSTGITCVMSGAAASTCNDTTHTAAITAGQRWTVQAVASATAAAGTFSFGMQLDTP